MISKRKAASLCLFTAVLTVAITLGAGSYLAVKFTPVGKVYGILSLLENSFYKDFDRTEILDGAARGVVAALEDPYSVYMTESEWYEFYIRTAGEYSGIGVTIGIRNGMVTIVSPMKGSPAEEAGLKVNDVITQVGGIPVDTSDEAASLIRGPSQTEVVLTIYRDGEFFDVPIVRQEITLPAVEYSMEGNDIGYLELTTFNEHSSVDTAIALRELKSMGAKAIVLDLRYNGGGLLDRCIDIANLFVPQGTVVTVKGKSIDETSYGSQGSGLGMPLIVLVNEGTASASEILAGAIQDYEVGTLVGATLS